MQITIKYFGLIAEITKCEEEQISFTKNTISELLEDLFLIYPSLRTKHFKVAQNKEIVTIETEITTKEIALLPPFAGG